MRNVTAEEVRDAMIASDVHVVTVSGGESYVRDGVNVSVVRDDEHESFTAEWSELAWWVNSASSTERIRRAKLCGIVVEAAESDRHPSQVTALATVESLRRAIDSLPPDEKLWTHFAAIISRPTFEAKFRGMQAIENDDGSLRIEWEGVTWQTPSPPRQDRIVEL